MSTESPDERTLDQRLEAIEQAVKDGPARPHDSKEPADFAGDKIGAGRYILSFFLAGLIGLWIAYWTRYYGWRGIYINGAIAAVFWIFFIATTDWSTVGQTCYYDQFGNYRCN